MPTSERPVALMMPLGDRLLQAKGRADGHHQAPDLQRIGIAECDRGQVVGNAVP